MCIFIYLFLSEFIIGVLRLNPIGTETFGGLSVNEQNIFFEQMTIELSKSIPVDILRIKKIRNIYELDENSNSHLLILFRIDPSDSNSFIKNSAKKILDDLNSLIKTERVETGLDIYNHT